MKTNRYLLLYCILGPPVGFAGAFLAYYLPTARYGSLSLAWMIAFFVFPVAGGAFFLAPYCFFGLFRWQDRDKAMFGFLGSVLLIALSFGGARLGIRLRMNAFDRLAARSEPLVMAIQKFATDKGRPPNSLDELLPSYLAGIPTTGMGGYPEYEYLTGSDAQEYGGNAWVLLVHAPGPGINFDMFMYFPKQNYPDRGYGGSLERIGTWAYVHE